MRKSHRKDFYRSAHVLRDPVLDAYFKGLYFNTKNHQNELLDKGINKYNAQLIGRINELNIEWRNLISYGNIIYRIIELNENHAYSDTINIHRLLHAQSGTIKFNKVLKKNLKKYKVNRQAILDSITRDLNLQDDRIIRNKNILTEVLNEYQLDKLIQIVENDSQVTLFDQVVKYVKELDTAENRPKVIEDQDDPEKESRIYKEYYDNLYDSYIEHLKDIANKHNISLNSQVTDILVRHREVRNEIIKKITEEKNKDKEILKIKELSNRLLNENLKIQHDISTADFNSLQRLGPEQVKKLVYNIMNVGYKVYYVAGINKTVVKYPYLDSKYTQDINKVKFFESEDKAEEYKDYTKENNEWFKNCYVEVFSLELPKSNSYMRKQNDTRADVVVNMELNINSDCPSFIEKLELKHMLTACNGFDCCNEGKVVIYTLQGVKDSIRSMSYNNIIYKSDNSYSLDYTGIFKGEKIKEVMFNTIEQHKNFDMNTLTKIDSELKPFDSYVIVPHALNIKSKWLEDKIKVANLINNYVIDKMKGISTHDRYDDIPERSKEKITKDILWNFYKRLLDQVNTHPLVDTFYYVIIIHEYIYNYLSIETKTKDKDTIGKASIFSSYNDAVEAIKSIYDERDANFYKIVSIPVK